MAPNKLEKHWSIYARRIEYVVDKVMLMILWAMVLGAITLLLRIYGLI